MTRDFEQHDEPRRARERHECPDPDCGASFGSLRELLRHGSEAHEFDAFVHLAE